jgi:hypothetical protein
MPEPVAMIVASGSAQSAGLVPADPAPRTRSLTRADWRLMLGLARTETVLVVGAEAWELGRALSPWVGKVYGAVDEVPTCDSTCVVPIQGDQASLPLTECSLDWIIFDGHIPGEGDVPTRVARVLPTLRPGGGVVVTFANLWGMGGLLQPRLKAPESDGVPCHGLGHAHRLMTAAGLSELTCYAMLPGRRAPRTLIPLVPPCPAAAEKFALGQAWKRASRRRAIGRQALRLLVDLRLLRYAYPQYLFVGRRPC